MFQLFIHHLEKALNVFFAVVVVVISRLTYTVKSPVKLILTTQSNLFECQRS